MRSRGKAMINTNSQFYFLKWLLWFFSGYTFIQLWINAQNYPKLAIIVLVLYFLVWVRWQFSYSFEPKQPFEKWEIAHLAFILVALAIESLNL